MAERFSVVDGQLVFGARLLGPSSALYVDSRELNGVDESDGVVHLAMPNRIDVVFVAGKKVVGGELKRGMDVQSSDSRGRLARQLVTIGQTCDVVLLGLDADAFQSLTCSDKAELNLIRYQMMGVLVFPTPPFEPDLVRVLASMRAVLSSDRSVLAPFSWFDVGLKPRRTERGWLLRDIPYVGPKLARKLLERFGTVREALLADDDEWKKVGVPKRVLVARRKALE